MVAIILKCFLKEWIRWQGNWRKWMRSIGNGRDWPLSSCDSPFPRTHVSDGRSCRSCSMSLQYLDNFSRCGQCGCTCSMRCYSIRDRCWHLGNYAPSVRPCYSWNTLDCRVECNPWKCDRCHCSDNSAQTPRGRHGHNDRTGCIWNTSHGCFRVSYHGHHRRRLLLQYWRCSRGQNGPDGCTCSTWKP